jgi:hypothetical protein
VSLEGSAIVSIAHLNDFFVVLAFLFIMCCEVAVAVISS